MTNSTSHRIASAVALLLSLAALLALLASPAQARRANCSSAAARHARRAGHATRACARARARKVRLRRAARLRRSRRAALRAAGKGSGGGLTRIAPSCEGGGTPVRGRGGSLSCPDGSEPACPPGMSLASEGSSIFCASGEELEIESDEGTCEAASSGECGPVHPTGLVSPTCAGGGAPVAVGNETFACPDGSVPQCGEGMTPAPSTDGTALVCVAVLTAEPTAS